MALWPAARAGTGSAQRLAAQIGMVAASCAAAFSIAYIAAQILEWMGLLGSRGGPNSPSTASGLLLLLTPSLLLAPVFLITMCALHCCAPGQRKIFTQVAQAFASIYAALISLVYYVQLTFVVPRLREGDIANIELLLFVPYRSFLFAVDLLGYTFMSLSLLFGAFGLPGVRWSKAAKATMVATGALAPCLALQMTWPQLIAVAALWGVTFPAAMLFLVFTFRGIIRADR